MSADVSNMIAGPVLHHAETLDLWSCAAEVARLAEAARQGKAARDELTGSTITLTSLGALGGIVSTPVINHPEVAIVGVNRVVERPVFQEGRVVARTIRPDGVCAATPRCTAPYWVTTPASSS